MKLKFWEKAAKASADVVDNFAPKVIKSLRESRSAGIRGADALIGTPVSRPVPSGSSLYKGSKAAAADDSLYAKGPAGRLQASNDTALAHSSKGEKAAAGNKETTDRLNSTVNRKIKSLRNENTARVAPNGAGYGNKGLAPVPKQMGATGAPPPNPMNRPLSNTHSVNDTRPNQTKASSLLANRIGY